MGYIYLIHFEEPYYHARHYIGWAKTLKKRIADHRAGRGSRLMQIINEANIDWVVAMHRKGSRKDERALKNKKHASRFCPKCKKK